jgi:hypothetical protein
MNTPVAKIVSGRNHDMIRTISRSIRSCTGLKWMSGPFIWNRESPIALFMIRAIVPLVVDPVPINPTDKNGPDAIKKKKAI